MENVALRILANPDDAWIARERAQKLREAEQQAGAVKARCERLLGFVKEAWHILEPKREFVIDDVIIAVCAHLEAVTRGEITRLLINVPPGMMKSLLVSVFWPAWEWGPAGMSYLGILSTSYSQKNVIRDNEKMRRLIKSEWYRTLWPVRMNPAIDGKEIFANTNGGIRDGRPFGSMTGGRGDRVICLPAEQRILTEFGWLRIGDVVKKRVDARVAGYDGERVRWQSIEAFETNPSAALVDIVAGHFRVRCTGDHPVFIVGRGWVRADSVQIGEAALGLADTDGLRRVRERDRAPDRHGAAVLQPGLLRGRESQARAGGQHAAMRELRRIGLSHPVALEACLGWYRLLLDSLRCALRSGKSRLSKRPCDDDLHLLRAPVPSESVRGEASAMLFGDLRVHDGVGSPRRPHETDILSDLRPVVHASRKAHPPLFARLREDRPCATDEGRGQRQIPARGGLSSIPGWMVAHLQIADQGARRKCMQSLRGDRAKGRPGASCPPHRLCEGEPGRIEPDHGLQILPWNDAWEAGGAPSVETAIVSAVERIADTGAPTFNIRVGPDHCYFAEGLLLHNCDDPHSTKTAESDNQRAATVTLFREQISDRLNDITTSAIVIIMQRLHSEDVSGCVIALDEGYTHLNLAMEFESDQPRCVTPYYADRRRKDGELLSPIRFPAPAIARLKNIKGPYAWAGQYQQRPAPRSGGFFKVDKIGRALSMPTNYTQRVRAWDLAASEEKAGRDPDWTAGVLMTRSKDDQKFYIGNVKRMRETSGAVRVTILATASQDKVDGETKILIPQDPGQAGKGQAADYGRILAGYPVKIETVGRGNKEMRADPFASQVEMGNVVIVQTGDAAKDAWIEPFLHELRTFPVGHDDQVDAAGDAFKLLAAQGAQGWFDYYGELAKEVRSRR